MSSICFLELLPILFDMWDMSSGLYYYSIRDYYVIFLSTVVIEQYCVLLIYYILGEVLSLPCYHFISPQKGYYILIIAS